MYKRQREIFGEGGLVMRDPTAPIWRAGANDATSFHTDANLDIAGLAVPKGDYTPVSYTHLDVYKRQI